MALNASLFRQIHWQFKQAEHEVVAEALERCALSPRFANLQPDQIEYAQQQILNASGGDLYFLNTLVANAWSDEAIPVAIHNYYNPEEKTLVYDWYWANGANDLLFLKWLIHGGEWNTSQHEPEDFDFEQRWHSTPASPSEGSATPMVALLRKANPRYGTDPQHDAARTLKYIALFTIVALIIGSLALTLLRVRQVF